MGLDPSPERPKKGGDDSLSPPQGEADMVDCWAAEVRQELDDILDGHPACSREAFAAQLGPRYEKLIASLRRDVGAFLKLAEATAENATAETVGSAAKSQDLLSLMRQETEYSKIVQVALRGVFAVDPPFPAYVAICIQEDFREILRGKNGLCQMMRQSRYHTDIADEAEKVRPGAVNAFGDWIGGVVDTQLGRVDETAFMASSEVLRVFGPSPLGAVSFLAAPVRHKDARLGVVLVAHFSGKHKNSRPIDSAAVEQAEQVAAALGAGLAHLLRLEECTERGS